MTQIKISSSEILKSDIIENDWNILFVVPGNPKALKRHRTFQRGKFTGTYDPSANDKADFLAIAMENKPSVPYNEALAVLLKFNFPRPKNHYRTGSKAHLLKDSAPKYHIGIPDADNLAKFVCDSFNKVFWKDDSCISELFVSKQYSITPCVEIFIATLHKEVQTDIFN